MVKVAFIHPDLGIGGAERFVCDAAIALQKKGHVVHLFTSHHDASHCFKETTDGTLELTSVGDWLPRQFFSRFYALWAYIRMIYVAMYLVFFSEFKPDIVICDQVSACVPVLQLNNHLKVVFYCHFPDMLLTSRKSFLKKLYRAPIDYLEEYTTGMADDVLVNSEFTANVFQSTFTSLTHVKPTVLYPSLNLTSFDGNTSIECIKDIIPSHRRYIFLSINRYERKKCLDIALNALHQIKSLCTLAEWNQMQLIIAGGYDEQNLENKEHFLELQNLACELDIVDHLTFVRSFSDVQKVSFLKSATALLYTPVNEHFGIVPIEAMYMKCPVIACNSGGPRETVLHGKTGFLTEPTSEMFAASMMKLINDEHLRDNLGQSGREHVQNNFSFQAFSKQLDEKVRSITRRKRSCISYRMIAALSFTVVFFGICAYCIVNKNY